MMREVRCLGLLVDPEPTAFQFGDGSKIPNLTKQGVHKGLPTYQPK